MTFIVILIIELLILINSNAARLFLSHRSFLMSLRLSIVTLLYWLLSSSTTLPSFDQTSFTLSLYLRLLSKSARRGVIASVTTTSLELTLYFCTFFLFLASLREYSRINSAGTGCTPYSRQEDNGRQKCHLRHWKDLAPPSLLTLKLGHHPCPFEHSHFRPFYSSLPDQIFWSGPV